MPPTTRRRLACVAVSSPLPAACTAPSPDSDRDEPTPTPTPPPVYTAELQLPDAAATILEGDEVALAAAASAAMFASAPVAVVAPRLDADAQLRGASVAVALG